MSSTLRGYDRHQSDYYRTPQKPIIDFLTAWKQDIDLSNTTLDILDPCAGGDPRYPMSYPTAIKTLGYPIIKSLTTIDIRLDSHSDIKEDYLIWEPQKEYDLIITNPPFNIAQEVIDRSLDIVKPDGYVVMLLRLNFFGSKSRLSWWNTHMPILTYVHSKRIAFTENNKTDSIEYMHAVWQKNKYPTHTALRII